MLHLQDLTVGQVSGMIAAAIFLLQFVIPIALPLVMLGLLRLRSTNVTATAVSWSVISRFLHSSLWPSFLQTDSASAFSTPASVMSVSLLRPFTIVLVGIAAIVTPLGLYESITPVYDPKSQPFHYILDPSPISLGTPPRTNTTWSRICGDIGLAACPNSGNNVTRVRNTTGIYIDVNAKYSSHVPQKVIDGFQSGLSAFSASVSSIFDIQYRSISTTRTKGTARQAEIDDGNSYNIGTYRPLSSLILSDSIQLFEGLVVDMKNGGIGFRNHSAPPWTKYGSTWSEDLLFIEPESVCVDTNLTLNFDIGMTATSLTEEVINLVLTDQGGFVNLNTTYPRWDRVDTQGHPELRLRAYKAAWLNNALSMAFMNVTNIANETLNTTAFSYLNSTMGKEFSLHWKDGSTAPDTLTIKASSLQIAQEFGRYLYNTDRPNRNYSLTTNSSYDSEPPLYPNPFGIEHAATSLASRNESTFADASLLCKGAGGKDLANMTNMVALCGFLYGAPRRRDGSASLIFDPGSSWTLPMYSCISTVKASIKTASFRFNGSSDSLTSLSVTSISPKTYPDEESKPLWGVENANNYLSETNPLWGLVTPEAAASLNLSTLRKEELYIPGYTSGIAMTRTSQNIPGLNFPGMALSHTYEVGTGLSSTSLVDYTGGANLAVYRLWQELSREADSAGKILNLIWTDVAANLVLGTRGLQGTNGGLRKRDGEPTAMPIVTSHERRIRYHYTYGIPAFLALALASAIIISSILLVILGPARLSYMRVYLQNTSTGRLLTTGQGSPGPAIAVQDGKTGKWIKGPGKERFTLGPEGWEKGGVSSGAQVGVPAAYERVSGYDGGYETKR